MAFALRHPYRRRARDDDAATTAVASPGSTRPVRERAARTAKGALLALARLVRYATGLVALIIVTAIVLRLINANQANTIVSDLHDAGKWLVGPFLGLFIFDHDRKLTMTVNWGIAGLVYLVIGAFLARAIARTALRA
ncbi:MAG: hypothetical protein ACYDHH_04010 [Solirubrobacteraceae bacterium]